MDFRLYGSPSFLLRAAHLGDHLAVHPWTFFVGWIVDLFLIPGMDKRADRRYLDGPINYNLAWIFLTFLGVFGIHRFYQGKWFSGIIYLCTLGIFGIGVVYDWCTLNDQIDELHRERVAV